MKHKNELFLIFAIISFSGIGYVIADSYVIVNQDSGQTTNSIDVKDSTGTSIMSVDADGEISAKSLYFTGNGFKTGGSQPDFLIYKDGSTIVSINTTTNQIFSSSTDASTVIQATFNQVNTNGGGSVHVKGYGNSNPYEIKASLLLPDSGNLHFSGDGALSTVFKIPNGFDNDMFVFMGVKTANAFFNVFEHFKMEGNNVDGVTNKGFVLNATAFGLTDSIFTDIFIIEFAGDGAIYLTDANAWNNNFVNLVMEFNEGTAFYKTAGSDTKLINNKFLENEGTYAVILQGVQSTFVDNFIEGNDKNGLLLGGGTSANVICHNRFLNNGQLTHNTYVDIQVDNADSNIICNNVMTGSAVANKVKHAIRFTASNSNKDNLVIGNNFGVSVSSSFGDGRIILNPDPLSYFNDNVNYQQLNKIQTAYKTVDQTIQSDNVLSDDTQIALPVAVDSVYQGEANVYLNSNTSADFCSTLTAPAGSTGKFKEGSLSADNTYNTFSTSVCIATTTGTNRVQNVMFNLITGATAGNVTLQWAQQTSFAGDTTVFNGSNIIMTYLGEAP